MLSSFKKNYIFIIFFLALVAPVVANAQDIRVIDNKGTISSLFVPSVSEVYPSAAQTVPESATNIFILLQFGSQDFAPNVLDYTNENNGIRVINTGRYKVTYRATSQVFNNSRMGAEFSLILNNSSVIPNTVAYTYGRNNVVDKNTVTMVKILDLDAGDLIGLGGRVYESNSNTTDSVNVLPGGTMLTIEKLD